MYAPGAPAACLALRRTARRSLSPKTKAMSGAHLYLKTTQVCLRGAFLCSSPSFFRSSGLKQINLVTPTSSAGASQVVQLAAALAASVPRCGQLSTHALPVFSHLRSLLSSLFFRVFHNVGLFSARIRVCNLLVLNSLSHLPARSGVCRNV